MNKTNKVCPKCNELKPASCYYLRKSGKDAGQFRTRCKTCERIDLTKWANRKYKSSPEFRKKRYTASKKWASKPDVKLRNLLQRRIRRTGSPDQRVLLTEDEKRNRKSAYDLKYYYKANRKEWHRNYRNKKRENISVKILDSLRRRINHAIRKGSKSRRTIDLLGCSIESFKIYLESRFEIGMSWGNYGSYWEIDHILPCAIFDLTKPDHQFRCFHFSNMRPLEVSQNRSRPKHITISEGGI